MSNKIREPTDIPWKESCLRRALKEANVSTSEAGRHFREESMGEADVGGRLGLCLDTVPTLVLTLTRRTSAWSLICKTEKNHYLTERLWMFNGKYPGTGGSKCDLFPFSKNQVSFGFWGTETRREIWRRDFLQRSLKTISSCYSWPKIISGREKIGQRALN